jgi:hypothetical protein
MLLLNVITSANDIHLITGELEENLFCFPTRRMDGMLEKWRLLCPKEKVLFLEKCLLLPFTINLHYSILP